MERRPENTPRVSPESPEFRTSGGNKGAIIVLAIIAAALAGILIWVGLGNRRLINDLEVEKADLTEQIVALQNDYDSLSSDYESINLQLDSSREEVAQLVERIQKTDATNRRKIRQYEKELGTLRSIMRNYIVQIDSLNTLNHKLTADAANARRETATVRKQNAELQKTVEDLSDKVETGAVIRGRNVHAEAYNKSGNKVDVARSTARILTSVTLASNALAATGPVRVYVVISDPDGNVLTNADSRVCNYAGGTLQTSASREVDYQGEEVDLSIYLNDIPQYTKGLYTVQVLTERSLIGTAQFMLR